MISSSPFGSSELAFGSLLVRMEATLYTPSFLVDERQDDEVGIKFI